MLSLSYISGFKAKGYYQLAAGYGTVGYEPEVNTFFGIPRGIKTGGVAFDIPMIHVIANQDSDAEQAKQFTLQVGTLSSEQSSRYPPNSGIKIPINGRL